MNTTARTNGYIPPAKPRIHPDTVSALTFVEQQAQDGFWGNVTLKLEAGRVTHIRQEQNFKPSDLSEFPRNTPVESARTTRQ